MKLEIIYYLFYAAICITGAIVVGQILYLNSRRLILDIMNGDEALTKSVNKLFRAGFYLLNFGFIFLTLEIYGQLEGITEFMETLSFNAGYAILYMAFVFFFYLYLFYRQRKKLKPHVGN